MKSDVLPIEFVTSERLTIDYINHADNLKNVFTKHFREPTIRKFNVNRERLVKRLLDYNKRIDAPKRVTQNIESLSQQETLAVITGQQPGIFSGPLYTVYKAITTTVICERLSTKKNSLVPIFWNASEDHDFSEVNHINMFRENTPNRIYYEDSIEKVAFSYIKLNKYELNKMLAIIENISLDSEFRASIIGKVREIIKKSTTISNFFSRFMMWLFGEFGLIMMEPQYFRDLMAPIFHKLIRNPTKCSTIINKAGLAVERLGYSPKIHKKPNLCNFFLLNEDGVRLQVTYNGKFQIANETFSHQELLDLLESDPTRFSSNALTRPLTQDFLFPTFAYVAGPNEIAYQAQLKRIYEFFSLERPLIFPRFGATIIEKKVSKILEKYNLEIPELLNPAKLLKEKARKKIEDIFNSFRIDVSRNISEMIQRAELIDKALIDPCNLTRVKILKSIEVLENKFASKIKMHDLIVKQQIEKANNNLFPNDQLQERQINVLEYMIKFGKKFLKDICKNFLEADYGDHRVIYC